MLFAQHITLSQASSPLPSPSQKAFPFPEILKGLEGLRVALLLPCPSFTVWLDERQIGRITVPHRCLQRDSLFWGRKTGLVPPWEVLAAFPSGDFRSVPGHCAIVLLMWARGGETTRYHAAICISACGVWSV